ncbi:MAG TPA: Nif3-like dinuclear metal center hexameric protein [Rhizobacter sp.]|nr:Nif3-like dinuclear metal center hexameric protein [Rhizobacter sp.]
MTSRTELESYLSTLLEVGKFRDYGPNGLQIEGKPEVQKLVSGVTASRAFIEAAIEQKADAVLVHHGLFWKGHDGRLTGWLKARVELLMAHGINLFAYHLPLDAHPLYGNNAQFGAQLQFTPDGRFGEQELGFIGSPAQPLTAAALKAVLSSRLGRPPVMVEGRNEQPIRRVAWCTGGAQGYFEAAIAAGADAYITGEISEPQAHLARETGVAFFACGHHASERYGAPALATHLAEQFGLEHQFIEIDNPA